MKPESSGLPEPQENAGFLPPQLWVPQSGPLTEAIASRWCQEPWRPVAEERRLAGMLQGAGISLTIGKPGEGDSDDDIMVRIKADAPVLRPDEPVPARPVL
jgi:hypothetical protein